MKGKRNPVAKYGRKLSKGGPHRGRSKYRRKAKHGRKGMSHCKYYAESPNETWTPSCCVEDGYAINDVHPYDVNKYCPFCGGKVKLKPFTKHPDLLDEEDRE